jgi:tRNA-Thr(GGU) m(6)t(6)A37 methyltransferase TsaA
MTFTFEPIGHIRSCFSEKFGIPRQPGLVSDARAVVEIDPAFQRIEAFQALEGFSHIWILFVFHQCGGAWKTKVRPPRLGGNRRVGVFASRSGFRPNPIGQSVVELVSIAAGSGSLQLHIKDVDLLDGTPVLDIKPYLPYADCRTQATAGYAADTPLATKQVVFSTAAAQACRQLECDSRPNLRSLITRLLSLDPRPGYADASGKRDYGMRLWDLDVKFSIDGNQFVVNDVMLADGVGSG